MGLETAHPVALERLNKRMTVADFTHAAGALVARGVGVRAFVLIEPPFVPEADQHEWLLRSIGTALSSGADVVSLVPTRGGNGAMEAMAAEGQFQAPRLETIERACDAAHREGPTRGRIFVDLWDLKRFADCAHCFDARRARLHAMNLTQTIQPLVGCSYCGAGS
jgi:uncharacterized Fe-S cluster-containing MiaB family protein